MPADPGLASTFARSPLNSALSCSPKCSRAARYSRATSSGRAPDARPSTRAKRARNSSLSVSGCSASSPRTLEMATALASSAWSARNPASSCGWTDHKSCSAVATFRSSSPSRILCKKARYITARSVSIPNASWAALSGSAASDVTFRASAAGMSALGSGIIGPGMSPVPPRACTASAASSRLDGSGWSSCCGGNPKSNGNGSAGRMTSSGSLISVGDPHSSHVTSASSRPARSTTSLRSREYTIRQTGASCALPQRSHRHRYITLRETAIMPPRGKDKNGPRVKHPLSFTDSSLAGRGRRMRPLVEVSRTG